MMKYVSLVGYFLVLLSSIFMIIRDEQGNLKYFFILAVIIALFRLTQIILQITRK